MKTTSALLGTAERVPGVSIILVNWNGWRNTIECLESLLHLKYPNFKIIVCDNASTDDSLKEIQNWANGTRQISDWNPSLSHLLEPYTAKPVDVELQDCECVSSSLGPTAQIFLLNTGANRGYAGGNNAGLRFALGIPDFKYAWLLNNDTVVEPTSLSYLVRRMEAEPDLGICGSTVRYYWAPEEVQAFGGMRYSRWSGRVRSTKSPSSIDYVFGASMLVRRSFVEQVGMMSENYFLYFEELDWAVRAKGKFNLGYEAESVIFHKEGASVGSHRIRSRRSCLSERLLTRNRLLFTAKYYPHLLPSVSCCVAAAITARILAGRLSVARAMASSAREAFQQILGQRSSRKHSDQMVQE